MIMRINAFLVAVILTQTTSSHSSPKIIVTKPKGDYVIPCSVPHPVQTPPTIFGPPTSKTSFPIPIYQNTTPKADVTDPNNNNDITLPNILPPITNNLPPPNTINILPPTTNTTPPPTINNLSPPITNNSSPPTTHNISSKFFWTFKDMQLTDENCDLLNMNLPYKTIKTQDGCLLSIIHIDPLIAGVYKHDGCGSYLVVVVDESNKKCLSSLTTFEEQNEVLAKFSKKNIVMGMKLNSSDLSDDYEVFKLECSINFYPFYAYITDLIYIHFSPSPDFRSDITAQKNTVSVSGYYVHHLNFSLPVFQCNFLLKHDTSLFSIPFEQCQMDLINSVVEKEQDTEIEVITTSGPENTAALVLMAISLFLLLVVVGVIVLKFFVNRRLKKMKKMKKEKDKETKTDKTKTVNKTPNK